MRILVTGSRDWEDRETIAQALVKHSEGFTDVTLVHGGATGADEIAAFYGHILAFEIEAHPANWDSCGPDCDLSHYRYRNGKAYCPRAGFVRNAEMVNLGADVCLAFIRNDSNGAKMTVKLANKAGIPTHLYIQND